MSLLAPCIRVWRRVIPPVGGAWIPFTAAQVAARRAAQMVLVTVCTSLPPTPASPPLAPPWPAPEPWREPLLLAPQSVAESGGGSGAIATPEPATRLLLAVGIAFLVVVR